MNIQQAKKEIENTVHAYLAKNEQGEYKIPAIRQRPILLMGPPGIGKTQIMEQIARECRIGLVAYTITHHTRQSAVGLPFIKEEEFADKKYSVTEYTMSEIIASVYRRIKESGLGEGILFIDEINCVSETLAPTMLQFLQCKTFGNQAIPEGWIIVAAGNPPEYNKSVRDFDMVTLDRVRYLSVEADYGIWKKYALDRHINSAILSYLEIRPKNFYRVEADVNGMQFVTARGWEDLSNLMDVYEELSIPVDETIIHEFLHHDAVAEDAAAYFDLYRKYQDDYGIDEILSGKVRPDIYARVYNAAFDERLSVVGLLLDGLSGYFTRVSTERKITDLWYDFLKEYRSRLNDLNSAEALECYDEMAAAFKETYELNKAAGFFTRDEAHIRERVLTLIKDATPTTNINNIAPKEPMEIFNLAKAPFDEQLKRLDNARDETAQCLEYAFDFMEKAFEEGEEMLVFVTELTLRSDAALFLSENTCERYMLYNEKLLVGTRRAKLLSELRR
jgi:hypothetical protein